MRFSTGTIAAPLLLFLHEGLSKGPLPVTRSGLLGIDGFYAYSPYCGHGCFRSFSPFSLPCSDTISAGGHTTADDVAYALAICRASSFPYLSSIAWCMRAHCTDDIDAAQREYFWQTQITGDVSIVPKWSYGETLAKISEPPTMIANVSDAKSMVLNMTMVTTQETFDETWTTLYYFFRENVLESYFALAIVTILFGIPIVLTWSGFVLQYFRPIYKIKLWLLSTVWGTYHYQPLPWLLGNVPTVGQSLFIALATILNVVFMAVGYETLYPQRVFQWYSNYYQELLAYWMWRTGALAFANLPILLLFSARNNPLLWITNWSHSTFMVLHRWTARLFLFQTLVHSIVSLVLYVDDGSYVSELDTPLWIWGCLATVAAVIIVLTSVLVIRQQQYELFLVTHIIGSVLCLVGCWYHVWWNDEGCLGYETWLYTSFAVWGFDRLARLLRILLTGPRRAHITAVSDSLVRVDVPDIRWTAPGQHVFVYFPTLRPFQPWTNHPFSVLPTAILSSKTAETDANSSYLDPASHHEKHSMVALEQAKDIPKMRSLTTSGLTMFIRKHQGATRYLTSQSNLLTFLEGPYPNGQVSSVLRTDRLLLIGGGIGITGLLSFVHQHSNVKLYYSIRRQDECLLDNLAPILDDMQEKEVKIGDRLEIDSLVRREASIGWSQIGVVVCGPASMCDDVRAVVTAVAREKSKTCRFELEIDAFSW